MDRSNDFRDICDDISVSDSKDIVDESALKVIWWSNVVCLPTIAVIGLACNILNILILTTNSSARRIPSWNVLLALAFCDCFFLLFAILEITPINLIPLFASKSFIIIYMYAALYIRMFASTFYKTSVLLVLVFNIERYICVCHPLRSYNLCSSHNSRLVIGCCIVLSFLCSLQWPICYRIRPCWDQLSAKFFYIIAMSDSNNLKIYYRFMDHLTLFSFNILPILFLCILNTRLVITLRKVVDQDIARSSFAEATSDTSTPNEAGNLITAIPQRRSSLAQRFNSNAMLFAVAIMLLLCVGPQALARLLFEHYGQYHIVAIAYTCVTQQLVFLNAALNFCLYCLVSERYRHLMRKTLKRLFHRKK